MFAAISTLCGCGYVGPPQVPTLDIPQAVTDLIVSEYGANLQYAFTLPLQTTEGKPVVDLRSIDLLVGVAPVPYDQRAWLASAKHYTISGGPGPVSGAIPAKDWIGKDVLIAVRATGQKGKLSDLSNLKALTVAAPLAAPSDLTIENTPAGFYLKWQAPPSETKFRVYRKVGDAPPELRSEPGTNAFLDDQVEFGTTYQYFVQATNGANQQSETVAAPPKLRADTFPPSVPTGLTAEPGANTIELSWERNTDPRFQGYNVYRSVDNGPLVKIASVITAPAYSDHDVQAGRHYRYQISAVGTNGLESEKSMPYEQVAQ